MKSGNCAWNQPVNRQIKLLMIGNSFCMNFLEEMHGIAAASGIRLKIGSVVAGACTLVKHWTWHQNGEKHYLMQIYDDQGFFREENLGLADCLEKDDWDIISYQDGEYYYRLGGMEDAVKHMEPYLANLVAYVRGRFPNAAHCFQQVWAYQVGYSRPEKSPFVVPDRAVQKKMHADLRAMALDACRNHKLFCIPTGDAWEIARNDPAIGDTLCSADCEHDGAVEGGRYLNACVWFEALFGICCAKNSFRPEYALKEEKLLALQKAAHIAVINANNT